MSAFWRATGWLILADAAIQTGFAYWQLLHGLPVTPSPQAVNATVGLLCLRASRSTQDMAAQEKTHG